MKLQIFELLLICISLSVIPHLSHIVRSNKLIIICLFIFPDSFKNRNLRSLDHNAYLLPKILEMFHHCSPQTTRTTIFPTRSFSFLIICGAFPRPVVCLRVSGLFSVTTYNHSGSVGKGRRNEGKRIDPPAKQSSSLVPDVQPGALHWGFLL